jgi:hypothetical protein
MLAMMRRAGLAVPILLVLLIAAAAVGRGGSPELPGPAALAAAWDGSHLPMPPAPLVRHADVVAAIDRAKAAWQDALAVEVIGRSVEGRALHHLRLGRGPLGVLLWSQMHGDEPTATVALFDVLHYLHVHRDDPVVRRLLDRLTLHIVPMLNPDGAERFTRRNAQGIDINRDALRLQTPEGRALKAVRDRHDPPIGFNLHNQNWRTSVGDTGKPAAISLLAVAYDEARSDNPGRVLAKKVCSVIRDALEPLAPGMLARYDDEFEVRAFGDNLTKWGTSVVLIESGPYPGPEPDRALVRLNFVALLTALDALASGTAESADPGRYESLPMNGGGLFHTIVRNATVVPGGGAAPFTADVGIVAARSVRERGGRRELVWTPRVEDLGDLRVHGALEDIDATGLTAAPLWDRTLTPGQTVLLPASGGPRIAPGQPGAIVLLRPGADDRRYTVERVIAGPPPVTSASR